MERLRNCTSIEQYNSLYTESLENPDRFWSSVADEFHWEGKWSSPVSDFNFQVDDGPISVSWFAGGKTNIAWNCIERNIKLGLEEANAFLWEGNDVGNWPVRRMGNFRKT